MRADFLWSGQIRRLNLNKSLNCQSGLHSNLSCFRYVPPLDPSKPYPMNVSIGFDNFEILKIDDRDFTVEINAYLIVKWKDARIIIDFQQVSHTVFFSKAQNCQQKKTYVT